MAVRTFKALFLHKDIKDVIEQNRMDHLNVMFTMKELKTNLDKIQCSYDSNISITSQQLTDKIERLEDLNQKLMDRFDKQLNCFDKLYRLVSKECKSENKEK